jgi:cytochrome c551/c552
VVLALVGLFTIVFLIEFATSTQAEMAQPTAAPQVSAELYLDQVNPLLKEADPAQGAKLVEQYQCVNCHRLGAVNKIAPAFVGIAERAAQRRPALTAAAYIYESITQPIAFVVAGFNPAMPQDYPQRLSAGELGAIIAYLLTPDAH